jgi:hypothetical protein
VSSLAVHGVSGESTFGKVDNFSWFQLPADVSSTSSKPDSVPMYQKYVVEGSNNNVRVQGRLLPRQFLPDSTPVIPCNAPDT